MREMAPALKLCGLTRRLTWYTECEGEGPLTSERHGEALRRAMVM
jgi:hypothetical protein